MTEYDSRHTKRRAREIEENESETGGGSSDIGVFAKLKSVSYSLIPLNELRDLPARKALSIISTFYMLLLMLLVYLVVSGYLLHKDDKYLTLEQEQYEGFGTCNNVPRQLDGRYVADSDGNWDISENFMHTRGIYDLTFTKFEGKCVLDLIMLV
jgi:hypothetical protein